MNLSSKTDCVTIPVHADRPRLMQAVERMLNDLTALTF